MKKEKGFTLIELVLVIALLGILAVTALPNIFSISLTTARENSRDAVVGAIQAGISLYAANQIANSGTVSYPAELDAAGNVAADRENPLFGNVIQSGVTRDWTKVSDTCYTWTAGGAADDYAYDAGAGTFIFDADGC